MKPKTNLKNKLTDLFDVYKHERRGILFFIALIILVVGFNYSMQFWVDAPKIDTYQLDSLVSSKAQRKQLNKEKNFFAIDVNSNDIADWTQFGFSIKQVSSIFKFREILGGRFTDINQISKAYVVDSLMFERIEPYLIISANQVEFIEIDSTDITDEKSSFNNDERALFQFDPNTISFDSLLLLGMNEKLSNSLIKYREWMSPFSKPDDLLKLYLYSSDLHTKLKPYIHIKPVIQDTEQTENKEYAYKSNLIIELNSADTLDLIKLYGIGHFTASQILKYRTRLGGYYSVNQLYEIKYIRKENIEGYLVNLKVDSSQIQTIHINSCKFNELLAHPYFDFHDTKLLMNYRDKYGKFISLSDFKKAGPLPDSFLQKVKYYIDFDE